jgi:hypothetical protein
MRTTARVTLTIEIEADGCWGENCQLKQIFEQAEESALGKLRKAFQNSPKKNQNNRRTNHRSNYA